jgi:small GTP-binding protein
LEDAEKAVAEDENLPDGIQLAKLLVGHEDTILRLSWSSDGVKLASASVDKTIRLWNVEEGRLLRTITGHAYGVNFATWSPRGDRLASCSFDQTVRVWNPETGAELSKWREHRDDIPSVAWSPDATLLASGSVDRMIVVSHVVTGARVRVLKGHRDAVNRVLWFRDGQRLASGGMDQRVRIWNLGKEKCISSFRGHTDGVIDIAPSPDEQFLASCSFDKTIRIWKLATGEQIRVLEGHLDAVRSVSYSSDGRLLVSNSLDGTVRFWRTDTWETVCTMNEKTSFYWPGSIAFSPVGPVLATFGELDRVVRIWRINIDALRSAPIVPTVEYASAKVVLVGESGCGKSALADALRGQDFVPQEATHGLKVWTFTTEATTGADQTKHVRETMLWDLAGQYDYQIVHQLFLDETSLALVVFDPNRRSRFEGVAYWVRALRRVVGDGSPRLLVAGRVDRGGLVASAVEIERLIAEHGFLKYVATSARTWQGMEELRGTIIANIPWQKLPVTKSPELWNAIRKHLLDQRYGARALVKTEELRADFRDAHPDAHFTDDEFDAVLANAQSQGLVWKLPVGQTVLLRPELMNACASAVALEARSDPAGFGSVSEAEVLSAKIKLDGAEGLAGEDAKSLLFAVVQMLIKREIAFLDNGRLIFPSKVNTTRPTPPPGAEVAFDFAGPVEEVYATLAVRLAYSGKFKLLNHWDYTADFAQANNLNELCGLQLSTSDGGKARLSIYFNDEVPVETKRLFLAFVDEHLKRRALAGLERHRIRRCPVCQQQTETPSRVTFALNTPKASLTCEYTEAPNDEAVAVDAAPSEDELRQVLELERHATAVVRVHARDCDVFFSYNSSDFPIVEAVAEELQRRGIVPWLDRWLVLPGDDFTVKIENAVRGTNVVVVFVGNKLGDVQDTEVTIALNLCIRRGIRVIPVLLPNASVSDLRLGLSIYSWVDFSSWPNDFEKVAELERGIRAGRHQQKA